MNTTKRQLNSSPSGVIPSHKRQTHSHKCNHCTKSLHYRRHQQSQICFHLFDLLPEHICVAYTSTRSDADDDAETDGDVIATGGHYNTRPCSGNHVMPSSEITGKSNSLGATADAATAISTYSYSTANVFSLHTPTPAPKETYSHLSAKLSVPPCMRPPTPCLNVTHGSTCVIMCVPVSRLNPVLRG